MCTLAQQQQQQQLEGWAGRPGLSASVLQSLTAMSG